MGRDGRESIEMTEWSLAHETPDTKGGSARFASSILATYALYNETGIQQKACGPTDSALVFGSSEARSRLEGTPQAALDVQPPASTSKGRHESALEGLPGRGCDPPRLRDALDVAGLVGWNVSLRTSLIDASSAALTTAGSVTIYSVVRALLSPPLTAAV